jgi:hypothetical protein
MTDGYAPADASQSLREEGGRPASLQSMREEGGAGNAHGGERP